MAVFQKFNAFVKDEAEKIHNLAADSLKVALTNTAPVATNSVLANIVEVSYTNISSRVLSQTSSSQTSGVYKLVLANLVLTASGAVGPFRYVVLYNDTPAGKNLIGFYDYGGSVTMANLDTFTINFSAANGVIQKQ